MERNPTEGAAPHRRRFSLWPPLVFVGCLLVLLLGLLLPRTKQVAKEKPPSVAVPEAAASGSPAQSSRSSLPWFSAGAAAPGEAESAAEIVARKARRFAQLQRDVLSKMAEKRNLAIPADVARFFEAAESGNWDLLKAAFDALHKARQGSPPRPELNQLWGPILATFNALEQVHLWPPQQYLDYGNAILDALRPGMAYVGGTDGGRGVPELLNATSDGEQHIVLTQNALADNSYLEYLSALYGDKLALPGQDDVQAIFAKYTEDAQQRYLHDQQFPNEPPQVKPGENIAMDQGKVSISGQVAVMQINELILQDILQKNPDLPFGLQESYPLKSTYGAAAPLGPITELRAPDGPEAMTADAANQSLAYWQETAQQVLSSPAAGDSPDWLKEYSKLADAQANLFASHGLNAQAEQAFQLALQFYPGLTDPVLGYVDLLTAENRTQDALAVARTAANGYPDNHHFSDLLTRLQKPPPSNGP